MSDELKMLKVLLGSQISICGALAFVLADLHEKGEPSAKEACEDMMKTAELIRTVLRSTPSPARSRA